MTTIAVDPEPATGHQPEPESPGEKDKKPGRLSLAGAEMVVTLTVCALSFAALVGSILMYSSGAGSQEARWVAAGSIFAFAIAAACAGAATGFLFGIPKFRDPANDQDSVIYNTNLGQVSDWLTKVLLGATLTQIGRIGDAASALFSSMAAALPIANASESVIGSVVVASAVLGFLLGWLATATLLPGAIQELQESQRQRHEQGQGKHI